MVMYNRMKSFVSAFIGIAFEYVNSAHCNWIHLCALFIIRVNANIIYVVNALRLRHLIHKLANRVQKS